MNDELRHQLHRAADEIDFTVPDLRPRARTARTRRRLLTVGTVTATLALATAVILPLNLGGPKAMPAETNAPSITPSPDLTPGPDPSRTNTVPQPAFTPGPVVAHEEIVERCGSQLTASVDVFGAIPDDLRVARDREYREGEIVRLVSDSEWDPSALCVIPRADGSGYSGIQATLVGPDTYRALEACSELYTHEDEKTKKRDYDALDLRGAEILGLAAATTGELGGRDVAQIVAEKDDQWYSCGWFFRTNGTINFFGADEPEEQIDKDASYVNMSQVFAGLEWDGRTATAQVLVWGQFNKKVTSVRIDDAVSANLWQSNELGLYLAIIDVIPSGTADDWSSEMFHIVSVDEHGDDLGGGGMAIPRNDEDEEDS